MRLAELAGRRVAILGLGSDTRASVDALASAGPTEILVVDDGEVPVPAGLRRVTLDEGASTADVLVRSPGFPRYLAPLTEARRRGAAMTTPLDLWMGTHGPDRTVVAITGTKGKSTVTDLLGSMARDVGMEIGVAGNLGVPVFAPDWDHDAPVVVLEVSSYQAADLHHVPDVAVLTYLAEDHLSWHGGVERYQMDKLRVLVNEGGEAERILLPELGGRAAAAVTGLGLRFDVVPCPEHDEAVGIAPPVHRLQNAALAAAALSAIGGPNLDETAVIAAAGSSLPGRLDPCDGPEGLVCVDDALASNPSATAAALAWLRANRRPTVVLLGGEDRGVDPGPLAAEAAAWDPGSLVAVTLPESGCDLAQRAGITVVADATDVADAVALAVSHAREGWTVLLSPGAPTPQAIGNWKTRSDQFREAILRA